MARKYTAEYAKENFISALLDSPIGTLPVMGRRGVNNEVRTVKTGEPVSVELGPVSPQKPGRVWLTNFREVKE